MTRWILSRPERLTELDGTGHILTAMKHHRVRRYIGHATPAVLDSQEQPTPVTRLIGFMPRTFMRRAYDEITGMTGKVMRSGLDWTVVRFIAPQEHPEAGPRAGRLLRHGQARLRAVSRADIAAL